MIWSKLHGEFFVLIWLLVKFRFANFFQVAYPFGEAEAFGIVFFVDLRQGLKTTAREAILSGPWSISH